jgi:hypothetical protein
MPNAQRWDKELPTFDFPRLIDCPLQPGNLKISVKLLQKNLEINLLVITLSGRLIEIVESRQLVHCI